MFEKEIKFIVDYSLNKLKELGSSFTFEKTLSTNIHPAIIQYISAELDYLIFEDRKSLLQKSVFDYSGPQIAKYLNLISREIKKNKRISYEDIKKLVIQAVSFNINYTIRPKWSLVKLVFDSFETKAADEIKLTLNSIYYYDYIKNVIINYIDKKNLHILNSTEFEMLINKLDKEIFSDKAEQLVDNSLYSIADFYNVGGVSKNKVSPVAVEFFLKEKNLMDYLLRLRKALPAQAKQTYEIDDIRRILYTPVPINKQIILEAENSGEIDKEKEFTFPDLKEHIEFEIKEENIEKNKLKENEPLPLAEDDTINIEFSKKTDNSQKYNKPSEEKEEETTGEFDSQNLPENDSLNLYEEDFETKEEETENPDIEHENKSMNDEPGADLFDQLESELHELNYNEKSEDDNHIIIDKSEIEDEKTEKEETTEVQEDLSTNPLIQNEDEQKENVGFDTDNKTIEIENNSLTGSEIPEEKKNLQTKKKVFNKDIFNFLSNKGINRIVSTVFNEDREDFANTMEKLMECNTYEESTEILKSVFLTYRINPYSKDAVALTNAVSNYFDQT